MPIRHSIQDHDLRSTEQKRQRISANCIISKKKIIIQTAVLFKEWNHKFTNTFYMMRALNTGFPKEVCSGAKTQ